MERKKIIITNNREIYDKFIMLNFSPEIILNNVKKFQIDKILEKMNKNYKVLDSEIIGDRILIKKLGNVNFDIYLQKK